MAGRNATHINAGRAYNESLMTSTCTITVINGKVLNRTTGKNVDNVEEVYSGICKIRIAAASAGISEREPLGQVIAVQESILSLPVAENTGGIPKDAMVLIVTNEDDPELVGRSFRVKKYSIQSTATQRRLIVEDVG